MKITTPNVMPWHNTAVKYSVTLDAFKSFMRESKTNKLKPYDNRHLKIKSVRRV